MYERQQCTPVPLRDTLEQLDHLKELSLEEIHTPIRFRHPRHIGLLKNMGHCE